MAEFLLAAVRSESVPRNNFWHLDGAGAGLI